MATAADLAEQLKLQGNQCFQRGKFHAAIDMYTEAIVLAPGRSLYYSNRALCQSKLERWESCRDDCELALKFDALNAKASYMLGTSLMHLLAFDAAVEALQTALSSAEKTRKARAFQQDIAAELRRAKKRQWLHAQRQRLARHEKAKTQLHKLFGASHTAELLAGQADEADALLAYVEHMAACFEKDMYPGEVPDYFTCPISMEIMHDPVTTPNGVSYERQCLEEHLRRNGAVDPLTRKKLTLDMLRPNTSLRAAIQDYLDKNSIVLWLRYSLGDGTTAVPVVHAQTTQLPSLRLTYSKVRTSLTVVHVGVVAQSQL
ncbi:E3 ubiquitin-protein ligase CHIP [Phytophthora cinnamomi]|uniref:E3 ubiquitin-protein ligase CHIP n=1 Tax=Phytophthora cinnamomi TaxID=4785 RepID=UPI00355A4A8D|nr:E3 ubiquitin-protein ligase CHIP [Phytophthora cinnamomi]